MHDLDLRTPAGAPATFHVRRRPGSPVALSVSEPGGASGEYLLPDQSHRTYLDLFAKLSSDFRLSAPLAGRGPAAADDPSPVREVLSRPIDGRIRYGYGDPCVVRVAERDYRLLVTSNDAPDAFPILASENLETWRLAGFVFPEGSAPAWSLTGPDVSDFWAPELHQVGDEWWVCFTARAKDGTLAIGFARSASPDGPFVPDPEPILTGGVIDSHIVIGRDNRPWLVWKRDDNDVWPRTLASLLYARPDLTRQLLEGVHARTATFVVTLWPWVRDVDPMEQFFLLQPLIEAVAQDLEGFSERLAAARSSLPAPQAAEAEVVLSRLRTRILAQRLAEDGRSLEGSPVVILQNDLVWEGHLIEGVWIVEDAGRYHLLYSGNDFSTALYGIGAAVADDVTGPYRKQGQVFLRSNAAWWGPGHPSVVTAPDGGRRMFLHGFRPHETGYKAFRALLTAPISLTETGPSLA